MKFILNNDKLEIIEKDYLNSGSLKYYEFEVEYNEKWKDLTIEAKLIKQDEEKGSSILVINNKVYIDRQISRKLFYRLCRLYCRK